jgi:hypothetical protein
VRFTSKGIKTVLIDYYLSSPPPPNLYDGVIYPPQALDATCLKPSSSLLEVLEDETMDPLAFSFYLTPKHPPSDRLSSHT